MVKKSFKKGASYLSIKGNGRVVVRARNKEEALERAKEMFEDKLKECDIWAERPALTERWRGLTGFEIEKSELKKSMENLKFDDLSWKNHPRGEVKRNRTLFG